MSATATGPPVAAMLADGDIARCTRVPRVGRPKCLGSHTKKIRKSRISKPMAYKASWRNKGMSMAMNAGELITQPRLLQETAHSIRLFPKGKGASAYQVTGIASQCDWAILSDSRPPQVELRKNRKVRHPRHIFISMRAPKPAIRYFMEEVLPNLSEKFVLITGSEDITIPNQTDLRWAPFDTYTRKTLNLIADHPLLTHWFAENLDEKWTHKVSPLPTGFVFPHAIRNRRYKHPTVQKIEDRPLVALCAHRVRDGKQWQLRKNVLALAKDEWKQFSKLVESPVSEQEFLSLVESCSFVMCVEGGGIDPSPKAWQAIQHGSIPIIKRTPASEAYAELPCLIIQDWHDDALNTDLLYKAKSRLIPAFDTVKGRTETLNKLSLFHWWQKILNAAPARIGEN